MFSMLSTTSRAFPSTAGDAREASAWAGCASADCDFDAASSDCAARNMFMTELARDREDP